jgi:3-hydroxyanthranilate 3,4-dioxygenase
VAEHFTDDGRDMSDDRQSPDPIDVQAWIAERLPDIQAGRAARMLDGELRVVVVAGRGPRSDWHTNAVDELFYQLTGDISVLLPGPGGTTAPDEVVVREGELWAAPSGIPHAPQRPVGSIGLVIERARAADEGESFSWLCASCGEVLREVAAHRVDPADLRATREALKADDAARTCPACGTVAPQPT